MPTWSGCCPRPRWPVPPGVRCCDLSPRPLRRDAQGYRLRQLVRRTSTTAGRVSAGRRRCSSPTRASSASTCVTWSASAVRDGWSCSARPSRTSTSRRQGCGSGSTTGSTPSVLLAIGRRRLGPAGQRPASDPRPRPLLRHDRQRPRRNRPELWNRRRDRTNATPDLLANGVELGPLASSAGRARGSEGGRLADGRPDD